ncbi:MAG: hypothetical protein V5B39_16765, partial [Accumulibacter sp.]|uniref:hypothetical protein n=1 Tax=Accumulibacter sp. TaxID=2053492 RepID=UPI002FC3C5E6
QGSRLKHDEWSSPVVGGLVPVLIRPAGPARRMSTGTARGGIRMTFQGLPGPNSTLTLLDEDSCTLVGAVGFLILRCLRAHWQFMIVLKDQDLPTVWEEFRALRPRQLPTLQQD